MVLSIAALPLRAEPQVEVLSAFEWAPDTPEFGGLSGLEVSADGSAFSAVSDNGFLFHGKFDRDPAGFLRAADLTDSVKLTLEDGKQPDQKRHRDMEGIAISQDGTTFLSAESRPRLLRYGADQIIPTASRLPEMKRNAPSNKGFEALAVARSGTLFAIPEGTQNLRTPFEVFAMGPSKTWTKVFDLPRRGNYRPVGADFGPDGHLYILTRAFSGFSFATHIERILFKNETPHAYELLFSSQYGAFDNLEGLATWSAGPNDLRLYAVSDDNFSHFQKTQFVEFRLKE